MKTIHLEGAYIIKASRQKVYALVTDFESAPKYFPSVAKSVNIESRNGNDLVVNAETKAFIGSRTFHVRMQTTLRPGEGFSSENTSALGVEHEVVTLSEVPEGTRFCYVNDVEIKSRLFGMLGGFLIKKIALWYWERMYIRKLKEILEK